MEKLGIDKEEAEPVFASYNRIRKLQTQRLQQHKILSFQKRMNVAVEQMKNLPPSYGPEICDSGAGPSAEMSGILEFHVKIFHF